MNNFTADLIPVSRTEALKAVTACMARIDTSRNNTWEKAIEKTMTKRFYPFWKFWRKETMNREQAIDYLSSCFDIGWSQKKTIFSACRGQYEAAKNIKRSCEISKEDIIYLSPSTIKLFSSFWPKNES